VRVQTEGEIMREAREARTRAEEQEIFRQKMRWY